jgi:dienelactone hydrolase
MMTVDAGLFDYSGGGKTFEGYLARPDTENAPIVLVAHAWAGQGEHEREVADRLATLGYVGFAIDVYGKGNRGTTMEENEALMNPMVGDRVELQARLATALDTARGLTNADTSRIAAIGYCFGGLCVLDIARTGADVKGVVPIHGIFRPAENIPNPKISAKVLALHGWDDPMAKPEDVIALGKEMTGAGADWQLHAFGNTSHAFTNKQANMPEMGMAYSADADRRSWQMMMNFLAEVFG